MNIKQLEYFITIVESNYNLSKASKILHVSQPGLTKFIKDFEEEEGVKLFVHSKGRLVDLSTIGKEFYQNALKVTENYRKLMRDLRLKKSELTGKVKVGIPPVILTVLFRQAIPKFIIENPDIELEIVEAGASELQKMLLLREIDIAFLIDTISIPNIQHKKVLEDEIAIVINKHHRLAEKKSFLTYEDLAEERLVILNDTFMLHHQIIKGFALNNVTPNIFFQSGSWDLLVSICENLDMVTLLPAPIIDYYAGDELVCRYLEPKFTWTVRICRLDHSYHNAIIDYVETFFIKYFSTEFKKY
ncbi:LysR family transcriptional regulator [uncultured Vagococcus sp.]|uniref:LysR family transcriptional regulator n=1 Tax=uncultured Vagococcus sp. TaxID=189676 RepID=UPI0028D7E825|nr:LysR family transcriptional regulator [uncultured Vagococcus sp.]